MFDIFRKAVFSVSEKSREGERLFREGIANAAANQHDKAIELFTRSIEIIDIYPTAYLNRGASYQFQERYLDAWDDYTTALKMEESDPSPSAKDNINALHQNMSALKKVMVMNAKSGDEIRRVLSLDGIDHFTRRWSEELAKILGNNRILIRHFVLEELKELHDLGGNFREFALNSGFSTPEYLMIPNSPETMNAFYLMKNVLCCFSRNPERMFEIRRAIIEKLSKSVK